MIEIRNISYATESVRFKKRHIFGLQDLNLISDWSLKFETDLNIKKVFN